MKITRPLIGSLCVFASAFTTIYLPKTVYALILWSTRSNIILSILSILVPLLSGIMIVKIFGYKIRNISEISEVNLIVFHLTFGIGIGLIFLALIGVSLYLT